MALGAEPSSGAVDWGLVPYFQNPDGISAVEAFSNRRYEDCAEQFDVLSRDAHPPEVERPATYMAAVCTLYAGRYKDALRRLEALSKTYPLLRHYQSFFQGKAHRKLGNFEGAIQAFTSVPLRDANGERAFRNAITTALAAENSGEALALLKRYQTAHQPSADLLAQVVRGLVQGDRRKEARKLVEELQIRWPGSSAEADALGVMASPSRKRKKKPASIPLSKAQRWKRAERLFSTHRSEESAALFQDLSKGENREVLHGATQSTRWRGVTISFAKRPLRPLAQEGRCEMQPSKSYHHILYFSW